MCLCWGSDEDINVWVDWACRGRSLRITCVACGIIGLLEAQSRLEGGEQPWPHSVCCHSCQGLSSLHARFRNSYWVWSFVTENVCILHVKAAPLSRLLHCEQHTHGNVSEGCCVSLDGSTSSLSQRRMTKAAWQTRCRVFIFVGRYDDKRFLSSTKRTSIFFFASVVSCPNRQVCITAALSERSQWLTGFYAALM